MFINLNRKISIAFTYPIANRLPQISRLSGLPIVWFRKMPAAIYLQPVLEFTLF